MNIRYQYLLKKVLSGIFPVLVLALILFSAQKYRESRQEESFLPPQVVSVAGSPVLYDALIYNNGTATLSFALDENNNWFWTDDPDFPLNPDHLLRLIDTVANLDLLQTISGVTEPEDYGLHQPVMTLSASSPIGEDVNLALGNQAVGDSGNYYLQINEDSSTIYVVDGTLVSALQKGIYEMMDLPKIQEIQEDRFHSISLQGETVRTSLVAFADDTGSEDGTSAVIWRSGGKDVTENDTARSVISFFSAVSFDACRIYKPAAETAPLCGFDAPAAVISVVYRIGEDANETMILTVGGTTPDGTSRYVRINDDPAIYSISNERIAPVLSLAASGFAS